MHCIAILAQIHYGCNYGASTLCNEKSMGNSTYLNFTSSILLLLCISKPHLIQDLSMKLANHMHARTHTFKNEDYCYFMCLYLAVISNSISI